MQQCHSMLRATVSTHEMEAHEFGATFQVIRDMLSNDSAWKPLLKGNSSAMSRRELVYRLLQDTHNENALDALYDERFVSRDSTFCRGSSRNQDVAVAPVDTSAMDGVADFVAPTSRGVHLHGVWSRGVGDIESTCPCALLVQSLCCFNADDHVQKMLADAGVSTRQVETQQRVYSACYERSGAAVVRDILALPGLEGLYQCETQRISDIHGVLPKQAETYFAGTDSDSFAIDGLLFSLSPRSGVSLPNADFVSDRNAEYVREQHRAVHVRSNQGDSVFNPLCGEGMPLEGSVAQDGFPVVSFVDESPATAACVRYAFEYAWYHTLEQPKLKETLQAGHDQTVYDDLVAESWAALNLWATRCEVKLQKVRSCVNSAAYDIGFVRDAYIPRADCPFALESPGDMALNGYDAALSPVPCLVLKRTLGGESSLHDPHLCWSSECSQPSQQKYLDADTKFLSFDMLGECCKVFNPVDMLRTDHRQVQNVPSLDSQFMHDIINSPEFRKKSNLFALKGDFMFPYAASRQTQCSAPLSYWPQTWQAPFGEILMDNFDTAIGFPYMAAVTGDDDPDGHIREIAMIPDVLQQDRLAHAEYGGSGLCREPNFAMPVIETNSMRLCEDQNPVFGEEVEVSSRRVIASESSIDKQCSTSARVSVGAGQGHTLGFLLPLLLPFVHRASPDGPLEFTAAFKDNAGKFTGAEIVSLFQGYGEDLEILPEQFLDSGLMEDTVHDTCNIQMHTNTDEVGVCFHNADCRDFEVCSARGLCEEVEIGVLNEHKTHDLEFGMTGRGCQVTGGDDGIAGASPWQRVPGFMQHLGFCSHKNAVTYERLQLVYEFMTRAGNSSCEHKHVDNVQWYQCVRNETKFDWINHAPAGLYEAGSADSVEFTEEYEADLEEVEPESIDSLQREKKYKFEFLRMQPHVCDMDYMHSKTLGFCKLKHVDPAGKVSKWMRMSELLSSVSIPLVQQNRSTENPQGLQCRVSAIDQKDQCKAGDKMRFMGLGYDNIAYLNDKQTQSIVSDGSSCQLCEIEDFSMSGQKFVRIKPSWVAGSKPVIKEYAESEICGSFGHVADPQTGFDCELDSITAVMPFVMMSSQSSGACSRVFKGHMDVDPEMMQCSQTTGKCLYMSVNQIFVSAYLNGMLFFEPLYVNEVLAQNSPEHNHLRMALLQMCVDEVEQFRMSQKQTVFDQYRHSELPLPSEQKTALDNLESLQLAPGMYYFNLFNTYEIPILYWQKYALGVFVFGANTKNRISRSTIVNWESESATFGQNRQFAWEKRLGSYPIFDDTKFAESVHPEQPQPRWGDLWSALNSQQLVPTQQSLRSQVYNVLARFLGNEIQQSTSSGGAYSKSAYRVGIGHAKKLGLARVLPHKGLEKHVSSSTRQAHLNAFSDLVYSTLHATTGNRVTIHDFQDLKFQQQNALARDVGQKALEQISDISKAETQYFSHHSQLVAATYVSAKHWVHYGRVRPKNSVSIGEYEPTPILSAEHKNSQATKFCLAGGGQDCLEYVPVSVHYEDTNQEFFVPYVHDYEDGVLSVQNVHFSEEAFVHEFLMSILTKPGTGNTDDNFEFLDPFDTDRPNLDSKLHAELSEQYITLHNKLPLAVKRIKRSDITNFIVNNDQVNSDKVEGKIREILQKIDNGESEFKQCTDDALLNGGDLSFTEGPSGPQSCVWNPFSESGRLQESRRRQLQSAGTTKKTSIVRVTTAQRGALTSEDFEIDLCAMSANKKNGYSAFHKYPNPTQDGQSCTFSDIAQTYKNDQCSAPSLNCDQDYGFPEVDSDRRVQWSVSPITGDDQVCRPDQAASPQDITEQISDINMQDAMFVGGMYLKSKDNALQRKRSRTKICMRTDSSCIAKSPTTPNDSPYSSLFYYKTDPGFEFDNPVDAGYSHLERTAWSQISPNDIRRFCSGQRSELQSGMGDKIKNLFDSSGQRLNIQSNRVTDICKELADKHPGLFLSKGVNSVFRTYNYDDVFWESSNFAKVYPPVQALHGLKCNTKKVAAPEGVGVKLFRLNKKFTSIPDLDTSFSSVTYSDRVLFRKEGTSSNSNRKVEQMLFGHYFGTDFDATYKKTQTHYVPTPAASFCSADSQTYSETFDNLHKFRVVNYQTTDATSTIKSKHWQWDWDLMLNPDLTSNNPAVENLARYHKECEDKCSLPGLCEYCGTEEVEGADGKITSRSVGACCKRGETSTDGSCDGTNGFNTRRVCTVDARKRQSWHQTSSIWDFILRSKVSFEEQFTTPASTTGILDANPSDPRTVCQIPGTREAWKVWDLAACYENDPYEHGLTRSWYLWSTSTACLAMMNFMDGTLSFLSMQLLAGLQARRSFWFAEIMLGSLRTKKFKKAQGDHIVPCADKNVFSTYKTRKSSCPGFATGSESNGKDSDTSLALEYDFDAHGSCGEFRSQFDGDKINEPRFAKESLLNYFKLQRNARNDAGVCYANSVEGTIKHIEGGYDNMARINQYPSPPYSQTAFTGVSYDKDLADKEEQSKYYETQYIPAMSGVQDSGSIVVSTLLETPYYVRRYEDQLSQILNTKDGFGKWASSTLMFLRPVIYPFFSFSGHDPSTDKLKSSGHFVSDLPNYDLVNFMDVGDYLHQPRFGAYEQNWRAPCQTHEFCYNGHRQSQDNSWWHSNMHFNVFFKSLHAFYPFVNNWWGDLISSRNMQQSQHVCQCTDEVPNLREIMHRAEGEIDDNLDESKNKYSQPYDFKYLDPEWFTMPGAKHADKCRIQCQKYVRGDGNDENAASDWAQVQSKILHQNLARLAERDETGLLTNAHSAMPLTLSPCIYNEEINYEDMKIYQYNYGWKNSKANVLIEDEGHLPKRLDESKGETGGSSWMMAARTFLDTMILDKNRELSTCNAGGSQNQLVTKPSRWAQVDARPGKYLMPCKPGESGKDAEDCHNILELVDANSYTRSTLSDGSVQYEINSVDENDMICTFELELETTNSVHNECFYDCDEFDPSKACSPYLDESSEACHDVNVDASVLFSHLPISETCGNGDKECHGLSKCQPCTDFSVDGELQLAGGTQNTCIANGLYLKNEFDTSTPPTPARKSSDEEKVMDYTARLLTVADKSIFGPEGEHKRGELQRFMQAKLRDAVFDMGLDTLSLEQQTIPQLSVDLELPQAAATEQYALFVVSLDLSNPSLYTLPASRTNSLTWWNSVGSDEKPNDNADVALSNTEEPDFARFDIFDAKLDDAMIKTDYESGCVLDASNIEASVNARYCKPEIENTTLKELRSIVRELYTEIHGLGLPVAPASGHTRLRVSHEDMAQFSWFDGLLPWVARSERAWSKYPENHPFLDAVLGEKRCEDEFKRTPTGKIPCYRDANFSAKTVVPFLADNYAWPRTGFSTVVEKGRPCARAQTDAQRQACIQAHEERLRVLSRQMIGSDTCKNYDEDGQPFMRACFASFCTDKSHVGRPDSTQYINQTHPDLACEDITSPLCLKSPTNDYHANKTICKYSFDRNDRVSAEIPSIVDMRSIRGLYANNEVFQFNPDFSRCRATFPSVQEEYNPPSSTKRCRHKQAPLGFSPQTSRAYLAAHVAPTLDRSHVIPPGKLHQDVFSVSRLWRQRSNSLWAGYTVEDVLQDNMSYPVGTGEQMYALLALDRQELGPAAVDFVVDELEARLLVRQVQLLPGVASDALKPGWVRGLAESVQADTDFLSRSRLYKDSLQPSTEGWLCRYTKTGLLSGSNAMYERYPHVRLMTPSPVKMRKKYPEMRGLHPLVSIRDIVPRDEILNHAHFGHLHMFWRESQSVERTVNVGMELGLFFETRYAFAHTKSLRPPPALLSLGWPHVHGTLRSGEVYPGNLSRVTLPVDISSLADVFFVKIKHSNATAMEEKSVRFPFYGIGDTYAGTRSTLDRGSVCHKSPLSIIPNSTLQEMLQFDACFMEWEDENVTSRRYRCLRGDASAHGVAAKNFTFATTSVRNRAQKRPDPRAYASCSDARATASPVARLRSGTVPLLLHELSVSERRRISPIWRRMMQLHQLNLTASVLDPREFWAPEQGELPAPVLQDNTSLPVGTGDIFDQPWLYQCPPNSGPTYGTLARDEWTASTDRTSLCSLSNPQFSDLVDENKCKISKNIDMCKVPGLESLCTLLAGNVRRIREANMRRVGMLSQSVSLYSPSSFWNNDNEYGWEIVAKTYQKMGLFSQETAAGACANVVRARDSIEVLQNGETICSSYYALALINLLETARKVFINLIHAALYLFDGLFELLMAIISSMIVDDNIGPKFFNSFMQRASDSFTEAFEYFVRVLEHIVNISLRMFLKSPLVDGIRRLAQEMCRAFRKFVVACVDFIILLVRSICGITSRLGLGGCSDSPIMLKLEAMREDVRSIQCTFIITPPCLRQQDCEIFTTPNFPDTCYRGVVGGTDALGGDMYASRDADSGRGSYACNSASHCRKSTSETVYCEECPGDLLANYHCSTDNKCQCGSDPSVVSTCTKNADCDAAESCIKTYGYQTASAAVPCVATGNDRVLCMKDSHNSPVGSCSIVNNFETEEMTPCYDAEAGEEARDVTGVCLFLWNSHDRPPEVDISDLFGVHCESLFGAGSVSAVPFCTSVITTTPFLRKELIKVYVDMSKSGTRRLLSFPDSPQKSLDFAHVRYTHKIIAGLGPRSLNVSAQCKEAFEGDPRIRDTSDYAYSCALWISFWNASLAGTGLDDVAVFDPRSAAEAIAENPDILLTIFRNLPRAGVMVAQGALPGVDNLEGRLNFSRAVLGDIWSTLASAREGFIFNGNYRQPNPHSAPHKSGRRLLQTYAEEASSRVDLRSLNALHHTAGPSRRLLETPIAVENSAALQPHTTVDKVAELQAWVKTLERDSVYGSPLQSPECVFGAPSVFLYFLQQNIQRALEREGWEALPQCAEEDRDLWVAYLTQACTPVNIAVTTIVNNTLTLSRYYAHLTASKCLSDDSKSCLVPPRISHKTPAEIFPLPNREKPVSNESANNVISEPLIETFIDSLVEFLAFFDFGQGTQQEIFWGLFSLKAAYDFDEYQYQVDRNLFSIGRLLRDWLVCDLEQSLQCAEIRNPLLPSFFAVFVLILLVTSIVPIPSVITFFMWTLGLTLGVVYISYGFSPLCFPRVPVCLFEGIYDIVLTFFPDRIEIPQTLSNKTEGCVFYGIDSTATTLAATETVFRQGYPSWSHSALTACVDRLDLAYCEHGLAKIETTHALLLQGGPDKTAIYYCITFNAYRVIAFVCVGILAIPLAFFSVSFFLTMIFLAVRMSVEVPAMATEQEVEFSETSSEDEDGYSDVEEENSEAKNDLFGGTQNKEA